MVDVDVKVCVFMQVTFLCAQHVYFSMKPTNISLVYLKHTHTYCTSRDLVGHTKRHNIPIAAGVYRRRQSAHVTLSIFRYGQQRNRSKRDNIREHSGGRFNSDINNPIDIIGVNT